MHETFTCTCHIPLICVYVGRLVRYRYTVQQQLKLQDTATVILNMKVIVVLVFACLLVPVVQVQAQFGLQCEGNFSIVRLAELFQTESPSTECTTQILTIVGVQDYVADAAIVFQALAVICEPACLEFARTVALNCVPSYVDNLRLACGKNDRSAFCYQNLIQNNGTLLLAKCFPNLYRPTLPPENTTDNEQLTNATTEASATQPPFVCSDVCRRALEDFRAFHGCCVNNVFNTSAFGLETFGIADYGLWGTCGVETVSGNCSSPFADDSSAYVLAAHGMLSLLAVLLAFLVIV